MINQSVVKMRQFTFIVVVSFNLAISFAFLSPFDRSVLFPYGRQLRAMLSGKIPKSEETLDDELEWWQSLSRNNTIDCECGTYTQTTNAERWANENITMLNVYPWSVSLVAPGHNYAYCGGTLINDRYVLAAASCVDGSTANGVEVLIGTWPKAHFVNNADPDELNPTSLIRKKVHRVIIHPKYIDRHLDYNIALLRLKGPVQTYGLEGGISPICLPNEDSSYDNWNASSIVWRFHESDGYILPEKRTELESVILSKEDCKSYNYSSEWERMPDTMICSNMTQQVPENHPYIHSYDCPGDAGGPLLVNSIDGKKKIQIGIDSWTACYGRPKGVGVYTRITEFLPWIKLHISQDGRICSK